ncbi:hypothetical protein P1P68_02400 [Streptomyces scabiei]|uniref:hypothetical protein n=1 Tax=Streptomyces scabiei TaxID=1930 RepID=UPI0029908315|nr:hypothetical protein [Streptomyces scabiei]MDW8803686.1 hypothetical protein [Streptomyces scabiei]
MRPSSTHPHRFSRRALSGLLAAAAVAGTTLLSAAPASALSWRCASQSRSIDTANYSGPWPDNWSFTVKNCAARSGSYAYAKATIKWDGPSVANDDTFDDAKYRLVLKKSVSGTDPTVTAKTYYFDEMPEDYPDNDGTYSTGTIKYKVNSTKAYADGTLYLDWRRCCGGFKSWGWAASPKV